MKLGGTYGLIFKNMTSTSDSKLLRWGRSVRHCGRRSEVAFVSNPYSADGHEGYVIDEPHMWGQCAFQSSVQGPGSFGMSLKRLKVVNVDF
jgi:hypothetical protein